MNVVIKKLYASTEKLNYKKQFTYLRQNLIKWKIMQEHHIKEDKE